MSQRLAIAAFIIVLTGSGCAQMTDRERSVTIGAAVGAVTGAVVTNGSVLGTATGAVVGGIIGNEVRR